MKYDKNDLEKRYAKILEQRQKNIDRNISEGRNLGKTKDKIIDESKREIDRLYDAELNKRQEKLLKNIEEGRALDLAAAPIVAEAKGAKVTNLSDVIKTDAGDVSGIDRVVALKSKLPKLKKMLAFAGPAAAALGSMGVAEKTMAGDFKGALGEAYDAYMPEAIKPTELGNADFDPNMLNDPNIKELQKNIFAKHIVDDQAREGKYGESVSQPAITTINEKEQLEPVRMNRLRQILQQNK